MEPTVTWLCEDCEEVGLPAIYRGPKDDTDRAAETHMGSTGHYCRRVPNDYEEKGAIVPEKPEPVVETIKLEPKTREPKKKAEITAVGNVAAWIVIALGTFLGLSIAVGISAFFIRWGFGL